MASEASKLIIDFIRARNFLGGAIDPVEIADDVHDTYRRDFNALFKLGDEYGTGAGRAVRDYAEIDEDGMPNDQRMQELRQALEDFLDDCAREAEEIEAAEIDETFSTRAGF